MKKKEDEEIVTISVRISKRLFDIIRQNAEAEDRSMNAEIRRTLEKYTKF